MRPGGCLGLEGERVAHLVADGDAAPEEIALLYARGTGVDHYERALRAWGLPVLREASSGYYDQRDALAALALLAAGGAIAWVVVTIVGMGVTS